MQEEVEEDEGLLEDDAKENGENEKVDAEVWWEKVKELEEVGRWVVEVKKNGELEEEGHMV